MCLTVRLKQYSPNDRIVYKRFKVGRRKIRGTDKFKKVYITPYRKFIWPEGVLVKVPKFSYEVLTAGVGIGCIEIHEGLHAYLNKKDAEKTLSTGEVIKQMLIPAYTSYILGTCDEIVALAMKMLPEKPKPKPKKKTDGRKRSSTKPGKKRLATKRKKK